jgi:DNA invertase Pin-like site-specific DNA recombinase
MIGCARLSTEDQNLDLQLAALKRAWCKRVFTDTATGAHVKRPELAKCFKALKEGDTPLIVLSSVGGQRWAAKPRRA